MSVLLRVLVLGMRTKFAGALRTRRWGRKTPRIDVEVRLLSAMNSIGQLFAAVCYPAHLRCADAGRRQQQIRVNDWPAYNITRCENDWGWQLENDW